MIFKQPKLQISQYLHSYIKIKDFWYFCILYTLHSHSHFPKTDSYWVFCKFICIVYCLLSTLSIGSVDSTTILYKIWNFIFCKWNAWSDYLIRSVFQITVFTLWVGHLLLGVHIAHFCSQSFTRHSEYSIPFFCDFNPKH